MNYTYSDIAYTFGKHPGTKDVMLRHDAAAVKQALQHLFLTTPGEKPFDPNFGIGIRAMLFELNSPISKLSIIRDIKEKVRFYEPRAVIDDVLSPESDDENSTEITVLYHVVGSNTAQSLNLSFSRIR